MAYWLKSGDKVSRFEDAEFRPCFFVHHPSASELLALKKRLAILDSIGRMEIAEKRLDIGDPSPKKVLAVYPRSYSDLSELAGTVDSLGGYYDYRLYDVDLRLSQRFMVAHGAFPMAHVTHPGLATNDGQYRINYRIPELKSAVLAIHTGRKLRRPDDPLTGITLGGTVMEGREEDMIPELAKTVRTLDPDIIYTANGDSYEIPHLVRRAEALGISEELQLGREPQTLATGKKGRSYFSYGNILYKPPPSILKGRLHIDMGSFIFSEGGIEGLIDMSRLACLPLQTTSRISPGSAITAMQVQLAMRQGCAIIWKKNRPEDFKTAEELILADRGGMIFEPEVGIHDGIIEVDFVSMYPNIMVNYHISPETLMCGCCPDSSVRVPELGYRICEKKVGLIPKVVKPLVQRRLAYKALAKSDPKNADMYKHRAGLLKWTLVTCFGYTGYKNARFGRIECHESINAYGREILIQTMHLAEKFGYDVLHGIIDSLWLRPNGARDHEWFCSYASKAIGIPLELEGVYRWLVFLPNKANGAGALNRYYGLFDTGELKIRGIFLRKSDTPELLRKAQKDMLDIFSGADNSAEFRQLIPEAVDALAQHAERLRSGGCSLEELVIGKRISRELAEYRQNNDQSAALRQLHAEGLAILPGQKVRYVLTEGHTVKPADLLDGSETYDTERYLDLLCRAGEDLLLPFGWTEEKFKEYLEKSGLGGTQLMIDKVRDSLGHVPVRA
ncbi:MAG: DNA polymerase domain-containing protein [Thermoplasmata archaeon]|nr:DNA polymerase domain-containing protein [Thermoplasmata archaeon]